MFSAVWCCIFVGTLHKEQHSRGQRWLSMRNIPRRLINDVTFPRQPPQKQKWVVGFIKALPNCCCVFVVLVFCFFSCSSHVEGLKAGVNRFVTGLFWLRRSKMRTVQILNKIEMFVSLMNVRLETFFFTINTWSSIWLPLNYHSLSYW